MWDKLRSVLAVAVTVIASAPWCWIAPALFSLLGLAGTATAGVIGGWMSPVLFAVSLLLLGRSFYSLYVLGNWTPGAAVVTWCSAALMAGFWTWQLV